MSAVASGIVSNNGWKLNKESRKESKDEGERGDEKECEHKATEKIISSDMPFVRTQKCERLKQNAEGG